MTTEAYSLSSPRTGQCVQVGPNVRVADCGASWSHGRQRKLEHQRKRRLPVPKPKGAHTTYVQILALIVLELPPVPPSRTDAKRVASLGELQSKLQVTRRHGHIAFRRLM